METFVWLKELFTRWQRLRDGEAFDQATADEPVTSAELDYLLPDRWLAQIQINRKLSFGGVLEVPRLNLAPVLSPNDNYRFERLLNGHLNRTSVGQQQAVSSVFLRCFVASAIERT